jgi:uncharacterized repeat protein (TIGR04138 family)
MAEEIGKPMTGPPPQEDADDSAARFERVVRDDGRRPTEAYEFLLAGLEFARRGVYGDAARQPPQHVTGEQLCHALRELAQQRWGPLAQEVLAHWNVRGTRDFGEMVFLLVEAGLLSRQDSDRLEDFEHIYDFRELAAYAVSLERLQP